LQAIGSLLRRFHNPLDDQIDYDEDPEGAHIDNLPYNEEEDKPKLFAAVKQDNIEVRIEQEERELRILSTNAATISPRSSLSITLTQRTAQ
jgi:hypothetical protein